MLRHVDHATTKAPTLSSGGAAMRPALSKWVQSIWVLATVSTRTFSSTVWIGTTTELGLKVGSDSPGLRGYPETAQPRCGAFKPLSGDIGKQDKIAVKAC
jgi:hypothetical protein